MCMRLKCDNIVTALNASSKAFCKYKNKHNIKPGWNDFVAEQHGSVLPDFMTSVLLVPVSKEHFATK